MAPARVLGRHFPDPDTVFATSPHPAMAGSDQVRFGSVCDGPLCDGDSNRPDVRLVARSGREEPVRFAQSA